MNYHARVAKRPNQSDGEPAREPSRDTSRDPSPESTREPTREPPRDHRLVRLERIRPFRARRERDASIGLDLDLLRRGFSERHRALGDVIDAWNALAPEPIRSVSAVAGLANGTLTIAAAGSSASYEISRVLRDGLERRLIERLPARIRRVKVKVGGDAFAPE